MKNKAKQAVPTTKKRPAAKKAASALKKKAPPKKSAAKTSAAKPAKKAAGKPATKAAAKPGKKAAAKPAKKSAAKPAKKTAAKANPAKWLAFVEKHGVVLASAKGPVPNLATEIAGEPIIGSWWSHPKGHEIFEVLSAIDEDIDVRCFKLVDGKVTFVHRRVWPALVRLARDGVLTAAQVESVHQEHTESGEHRTFNLAFPDWVPEEVATAADGLTTDAARADIGTWL